MGASTSGNRDVAMPIRCRLRLAGQHPRRSRCQGPFPRAGNTQPVHDFRTHFIASPANTYATMHYDIGRLTTHTLDKVSTPRARMPAAVPRQPAWSSAMPPSGRREVDRNAVGDGHREQQPGVVGDRAVDSVEHGSSRTPNRARPRGRRGPGCPAPFCPGSRSALPEDPPAAHHLAHRRLGPEAEIEASPARSPAP